MDHAEIELPFAGYGVLGMILGHWHAPETFGTAFSLAPHAASAAHGIVLPKSVTIRLAANDDGVFHLRRPPAADSPIGRSILSQTIVDPGIMSALSDVMRCPLRSWSPVPLGELADRYQAMLQATRADDDLLARYRVDPWAVLHDHGVEIPRSVPLKVLIDRDDLIHMVVPAPPSRDRCERFLERFTTRPARVLTT